MNTQGKINLEEISRAVQQLHGIPVHAVEPLPVGMVGRHYKVESSTGTRYFLTLYDDARLARIAASKLHFTLPAVHRLYHSGKFTDLVPPLVTVDNELHVDLNGWPLIVYPYQDGHLLADEMPMGDDVQAALGVLVARLHTASSVVEGLQHPLRETYTFPFEEPLRDGMARLEKLNRHRQMSGGQAALREIIVPIHDKVLRFLGQLFNLAGQVRENAPPFVLCHTDIHPWNVIRDPDGKLVLIDWEGACLAPPEHDLFIFTGEGFEVFLEAYYHAGGQRDLRPETFSFYFYRRNLEDLADFIVRILDEENGPETDRADIEGVEELVGDWERIPLSTERVEAVLRELGV